MTRGTCLHIVVKLKQMFYCLGWEKNLPTSVCLNGMMKYFNWSVKGSELKSIVTVKTASTNAEHSASLNQAPPNLQYMSQKI